MLVDERVECKECGHIAFRYKIKVDEKQAVLPDIATTDHGGFNYTGRQEHARELSEVYEYLDTLKEHDREMMHLSAVGCTRKEIANELGLPEGTVARRLVELRLKLAEEFRGARAI